MILGQENKPPLNEATLIHFGVKGMKWGVHKKKDEPKGRQKGKSGKSSKDPRKVAADNALKKKWMAVPETKRTKAEAEAALAENQKKFLSKFGDDGSSSESKNPPKKGLTDGQKAAIKIGIGVAVVGGLMLYGAHQKSQMRALAGQPIELNKFTKHVDHSKVVSWGAGGYIKPSSHLREEFELPVGHTFNRISKAAETSFGNKGTYATHNTEDFHRYIAAFRQEKGNVPLHHVTWTAKEPIKVPNLATTLETFKEAYEEHHNVKITDLQAKLKYEVESGGSWSGPFVYKFFQKLDAKGYGAIVDEMDAGVIGETPLVVFAHRKMSEKISTPLTSEVIQKAESSLIELTNRKL